MRLLLTGFLWEVEGPIQSMSSPETERLRLELCSAPIYLKIPTQSGRL